MTTKFSFEVPIPNLNDFTEDQDYIFALSFLFENPAYRSYIHNSQLDLIIDNSFNELQQPEPVEKLIDLFNLYNPSAIVCPDSDDWTPQKLIRTFYKMRKDLLDPQIMAVARHPKEIKYFSGYGLHSIGIPFIWRNTLDPREYYGLTIDIHFLGLNNISEIKASRPKRVDTSIPIKLALCGWTIQKWIDEACPHIHTKNLLGGSTDFFTTKMTTEQVDLAKFNILKLKELCNEK